MMSYGQATPQELNLEQSIWDILSSDLYSNIISTLELVVAIITIIIGGKKVLELISEYKKKQREAVADCRAKRTPVPYSADSLRHN